MDSAIRERLDCYVATKGLRQTNQRLRIVEEIFEKNDHFTVEDLLEHLRAKRIKASRATVYRTVSLLVDAGLLVEIELGDGITTYDPNVIDSDTHNHLICVDCGQVSEFDDPHLDVLSDCLTRRLGFQATKKTLRIEGCCDQLRKTGSCQNLIQARLNGKRMPNGKR